MFRGLVISMNIVGYRLKEMYPDAAVFLCCSTLALTRISSEDEAIYQCIAENSAGTNQASARLAVAQVKDLPAAPDSLTASALSSNTLQLTWSQPPSSITDSIIGYVLHIRKMGGELSHSKKTPSKVVQGKL